MKDQFTIEHEVNGGRHSAILTLNGKELRIYVSSIPGAIGHLTIEASDSLVVLPVASNMVRIGFRKD